MEKFEQLNFFGVEADNIFSTAYVAALYLKHTMNLTGKVYLIGTTSFEEELRSNGIETVGVGVSLILESLLVYTYIQNRESVIGNHVLLDACLSFRPIQYQLIVWRY